MIGLLKITINHSPLHLGLLDFMPVHYVLFLAVKCTVMKMSQSYWADPRRFTDVPTAEACWF